MTDHGPVPPGTLVSPHFSFGELTVTEHRDVLAEQADPPAQVRANLRRLAVDLLEPVREIVGRLHVNSGYRSPALNAAIPGSSRTSRHMDGLAADVFPLDMSLHDAYQRIFQSSIPWDQLIWEWGRWIHVGAALHGQEPRRQALMIFAPGRYEPFAASDPRFRGAA